MTGEFFKERAGQADSKDGFSNIAEYPGNEFSSSVVNDHGGLLCRSAAGEGAGMLDAAIIAAGVANAIVVDIVIINCFFVNSLCGVIS